MAGDHADFPADWSDADIDRVLALLSSDNRQLASTLVHFRFVCRQWRAARGDPFALLRDYESTFHRQMLTGESEAVVQKWLAERGGEVGDEP